MLNVLERWQWLDGAAIGASALCLFHCLVLPAAILLLPALAAFLAIPEAFHVWAVAFAIPSSILALWTGHRRHRFIRPTLIVVPGLLLLVLGAFAAPSELGETVLTVLGALLVALGHGINWRAVRARMRCQSALHRA